MNCNDDVILILDSIIDDYYFVWECFDEYKCYRKNVEDPYYTFSVALKTADKNRYLNFFIGINFSGEEELLPDFELTDSVIEKLLNRNSYEENEIRITTSDLGIVFLEQCYKAKLRGPSKLENP